MTPTTPLQASFTATPLPIHHPSPHKNFDHTFSLESNPSESWHKSKNFLKSKGQRKYPTMCHDDKVGKTINADKAQLFAESVERHFGIESKHFDSNHFNEVNKFIEDNHRYFFILLKTQITTGLTWKMSTTLWKMSTLNHSLS